MISAIGSDVATWHPPPRSHEMNGQHLQNVRCRLLLRKKPCPEGLLTQVSPATRDVHLKKPTLSVWPYRSAFTGDDPKGLVLTSTTARFLTVTSHRRDGFSESMPLREPLNRLRWMPHSTLPL